MEDQQNNPPDMTVPAPSDPSAWFIKTPGARPAQDTIVISADHIIHRNNKDFVLYGGLLNAAHKAGLQSIRTSLVQAPSQHNGGTAVVHATAEFPWGSFDGIGDADDGNVGKNIAPHKIRMAETRAKARALRDALNVSMVAIEEMGPDQPEQPNPGVSHPPAQIPGGQQNRQASNGSGAAPRPVGERKSYGTPMTKGPAQNTRNSWPGGE